MTAPAAAADVELLVLDVDGVLTDGRLYYGPEGELLKAFHVRDGLGIKLLALGGVKVAIITARTGPALERRLADLGVELIWTGRSDKAAALAELQAAVETPLERMAYVGDDLTDLPALRLVGLPVTVADGAAQVRASCRWITEAAGGCGAVREVAEGILARRGRLDDAIESYLSSRTSP